LTIPSPSARQFLYKSELSNRNLNNFQTSTQALDKASPFKKKGGSTTKKRRRKRSTESAEKEEERRRIQSLLRNNYYYNHFSLAKDISKAIKNLKSEIARQAEES
jgi:hypothetical protein